MNMPMNDHDSAAAAVVDGITALKMLLRDGDPNCKCAVCALIRASARLADHSACQA